MVSVIVLTHNSARTLSRTLEGLIWCDECIIIDDNSTDDTQAIAKTHHATIFHRVLKGDFAAQRNFGLDKAKGDWVLFIDADEVVSDLLRNDILDAIKDNVQDGYYLKRQDTVWGRVLRHGETDQVRLIRLGRKGAGVWVRPVHEVWQIHGYLRELAHPLLHFPHPNVAQFLRDINEYTSANALYLFDQGVRVSGWHIIVYPLAKFFVNYFLRLGFLDGTPGTILALMMSFHSFLTRAKLWHLWQKRG